MLMKKKRKICPICRTNRNHRSKKSCGWFYGIIKTTQGREHSYSVHEIFPWGKNGKLMWTSEPITVQGESLNDLRWALTFMLSDSCRVPVFRIAKDNLVEIEEDAR